MLHVKLTKSAFEDIVFKNLLIAKKLMNMVFVKYVKKTMNIPLVFVFMSKNVVKINIFIRTEYVSM